jgi:tetratricopeptide (TPR) repeat protein
MFFKFMNTQEQKKWVIGRKRPFLLVSLFLMTVLLLAACGGGEQAQDDAPPAPGEATAEPVVTDTPSPPVAPSPEPTPSAAERFARGGELMDADKFDEAAAEFQAALALEPDNPDIMAALGGAFLDMDNYDAAVDILNQALTIEAEHPLALSNLCGALALRGDDALYVCQQALAVNEEDADTYNGLGVAYGQQGQLDEAIINFQEAIRLNPEHEWAYNNLGFAYLGLEQFDEAIAALQDAVRVAPDNLTAYLNLAQAYAVTEQYEDAIAAYQEALRLAPQRADLNIDIAVAYTRLDRPEEAIAAFETYLELVPDAADRDAIEAEIARLGGGEPAVGEETPADGSFAVDYTDPASVLQAVFQAAASGNYQNLAGLCDPLGENDEDTALICEITADHEAAEKFAEFFGDGRINGDVTINGDTAELPFLFGPDGDQAETMVFIQRDGKWYLFEF